MMGRVTWSPGRLDARALLSLDDSWRLAGLPNLQPRVSLPPFVPAHSSAALQAKAHALIERAAAFAPPALAIHERPTHVLSPSLMAVQPY
jgi:hypothetical protein